jgi:Ca-activated chloride channel homolog
VPYRDLVIDWQLPAQPDGTSLTVMTFRDGTIFEYFLAMATPPGTGEAATRNPREIVLLVDRSGSMRGPKWQAADWAVQRFLSSLNEYDSFSVGLFHSQTRWLASQCLTASADNVSAARRFVDEHTDSGGTELETALREALECGRSPGQRARHVVIITDAQVTNAATILELTRVESKAPDRRRISVLCIDAAPNSHLVHELVAIGGGRASFVTSDPDQEDIATALDDVLSWWDEPADTGLAVTVNRPDAWVMGRKVEDDLISGRMSA